MNLHKDEKVFLLLLVSLFCITAVFYYYSFGLENYQVITNLIFLVHPFLAVLGGVAAVKAFGIKNRHGKSFLYITLGILCLFIGELLYAYFLLILKIDPFPSAADIFYISAYPLLLTGIFREIFFIKTLSKQLQILY